MQGAGNFDSVRKELVEATRVIRDGMSERLKVPVRHWFCGALDSAPQFHTHRAKQANRG